MIYKVEHILKDLESHIENNKPFSHIRFGDGGLKFINSLLYDNDAEQLNVIIKKEGLPRTKLIEIYELWGYYARQANYIDSPEVYYTNKFWPRIKGPGKPINKKTDAIMKNWKTLYNQAEFDNENYCNPESNCLFIIRRPYKKNLIDVLKNKKVCCITTFPEVKELFPNMDVVKIVGQWQNHYDNSFKDTIDIISKTANKYDFWLVAAGELGRIYSGLIKENGGRSIDIGFVIEYWLKGELHPRFHKFLKQSKDNKLELVLTDEGKQYGKHF